MRLNRFEYFLTNLPVRAALQRNLEARWLLKAGGPMDGGRALEVGCGRGIGAEIILRNFGADSVDAFDLDARMVEKAKKRLARYGSKVRVTVGDAVAIDAPEATYDAVFDFAIIHHIPDWRRALSEIHRVLKPGGRFYADEILRAVILHPLLGRLLHHPLEDRFDAEDFVRELTRVGLKVKATKELGSGMVWVVAQKTQRELHSPFPTSE